MGFVELLTPGLNWPKPFNRTTLRSDLEAGVVGAILALPQAIALATLAGMPPQYGIYASILPVIVALIWGSSWFTLSGPNTAVSVMLAATILPFAAIESERFIELIFLLSLFVGLIQLSIGFLKLGVILDFISSTVILAVIQAVAIILVTSSIVSMSLTGLTSDGGLFGKLSMLYAHITEINRGTLLIGTVTIIAGYLAKLVLPRYALLIAMLAGSLFAFVLSTGEYSALFDIPLLGSLSLSFDIWQLPRPDQATLFLVITQWDNAIAIAFLGLMQTVIISRSLAVKSGQSISTRREIIGQGLANTLAPLVSAFAGSGSFNRSATNYQAGARTPYAGIVGVGLLIVLVSFGQQLLGFIPKAVISATLFLVGIGLFDIQQIRQVFLSKAERWIFILTFSSSILMGLNVGVLVGILSSLIVYLWHTSQPNIIIDEYLSENGRTVKSIGIDGNLFFGSLPAAEARFVNLLEGDGPAKTIVIKTNHLTYIDIPGASLIIKTVKDARRKETDAYIYLSRSGVLQTLKQAGMSEEEIDDFVIFEDRPHPMTRILYPYQASKSITMTELSDIDSLVKQIKKTALLNKLTDESLVTLLENNLPRFAESGEIIIKRHETLNDHLILIDGELEVQRIWSIEGENDKSHTWTLAPDSNIPALLPAASSQFRARALSDIQYILLNADEIDRLLGWATQTPVSSQNSCVVNLMHRVAAKHAIPKEILENIMQELKPVDVEAGEVIIWEGERGDRYYMIEEGEAEVIRTDPVTEETEVINQIGAGDCFGEQALIEDSFRSATIRMLSPGRLQVLSREAFAQHVQTELVSEISPIQAFRKLNKHNAMLLDCRSDAEYKDCRLKNAILIPLHELRSRIHELSANTEYLVYCRNGQRSKAAAYLLQERNIKASSIIGGIKDWPFEIIYGESKA